jgi:hypothetical protein
MRRGFAACNIADFRAGVGLRRYFGLRGPVEKFRSMEFDLSSRDADCRLRRRDNGGSYPPIVRGYQGCVFPVSGARFVRLGRSRRAKSPNRRSAQQSARRTGYFKTSIWNNNL